MTWPHILTIYEKPKVGNKILARYDVQSYRHKITATGWFDTASFSVKGGTADQANLFLEQYIGNRIAIHVDNPYEPIWEGIITRLTFNGPGAAYTTSIDEMANSVLVNYTGTSSTTTVTPSSAGSNATSVAQYGWRYQIVDGGLMNTGSGVQTFRDTYLVQHAWPKSSFSALPNGNGMIDVQAVGIYQTLQWEPYRDTGATDTDYTTLVTLVKAALVNGSTFFDATDNTGLEANALLLNRQHVKGESALDVMNKIAESGDSNVWCIWGIEPTNWNTGKRRMYYRRANMNYNVRYISRIKEGLRVRNLTGDLVAPWRVVPDKIMQIQDYLVGYDLPGDNPTEFWIAGVEYDADRMSVRLFGDDDTGIEGAFNYRRYLKARNVRNGAPRRLV